MNIEKWIVAHFSPTGGTKKVADAIAAGLKSPVVEMDFEDHPDSSMDAFIEKYGVFFRKLFNPVYIIMPV